jgi:hypothetical protein
VKSTLKLELLTPDDEKWQRLYDALPLASRDVFYAPAYAAVCKAAQNRNDRVMCAAADTDGGPILYPFAVREISRLVGQDLGPWRDITGLYGRNGVVCAATATSALARFHDAMGEWAVSENVICGFDRYHPVIANEQWASHLTDVRDIGGFVVVDLRPTMDEIRSAFKGSVRTDLRRAERLGVRCFISADPAHIQRFAEIYRETMVSREAHEFYLFDEEYFRDIHARLGAQAIFIFAGLDGEIVSGDLVLHDGLYGHYFLSGTVRSALPSGANLALKIAAIEELRRRGAHWYLLGGGYRPNDGLFSYKRSFAPNGVLPSRIGGTVWNADAYDQLKVNLGARGVAVPPGRFQFYDPD